MYVLQYSMLGPDSHPGNYVALDSASGGYPYRAPIHLAQFWLSLEDAQRYSESFPKEQFTVKKVTFVVGDRDGR